MGSVRIQQKVFDSAHEERLLRTKFPDDGALVTFKGYVRGQDQKGRPLKKLYLEYYPVVTEKEIERIVKKAERRWLISGCTVIHRVGELKAGEPIILVLASARHRTDAFHAVDFIMDYLKAEAPFWKKEYLEDGSGQWVEAKQSDIEQKARWELEQHDMSI